MNKEYRVAVRFDQVQVGHLAIFATSEEEAKAKAMTMMENHKNPEVLDITEAPKADYNSAVGMEAGVE